MCVCGEHGQTQRGRGRGSEDLCPFSLEKILVPDALFLYGLNSSPSLDNLPGPMGGFSLSNKPMNVVVVFVQSKCEALVNEFLFAGW